MTKIDHNTGNYVPYDLIDAKKDKKQEMFALLYCLIYRSMVTYVRVLLEMVRIPSNMNIPIAKRHHDAYDAYEKQ